MRSEKLWERVQIEEEILSHVWRALRVAADVEPDFDTAEQWRERVAFLVDSFSRHLRRLFAIEEEQGYLDEILLRQPRLMAAAERLRRQHAHLLSEIRLLGAQSHQLSPDNLSNLFSLRQRLQGFFNRLDEHRRRERELILEALYVEIGGEG